MIGETSATSVAVEAMVRSALERCRRSDPEAREAEDLLSTLERRGLDEVNGLPLARFLHGARQSHAAYTVAGELLEMSPGAEEVVLFNIDLALYFADFDKAIRLLRGVCASHPTHENHRRLVRLLFDSGRIEEAAAFVDELSRANGDDTRMLLLKAMCEAQRGDMDAAVAAVERAVSQGRAPSPDLRILVQDFNNAGDAEAEERLLLLLVDAYPESAELAVLLADVQSRRGDPAASAESTARALTFAPSAVLLQRLTMAQIALGDLDAAGRTVGELEASFSATIAFQVAKAELERALGNAEEAGRAEDLATQLFMRKGFSPWHKVKNKIVGVIAADAFGDFLVKLLLLATIKKQFSTAWLTLIYHDNLPFKGDLLRFCPDIDELEDYGGRSYDIPERHSVFASLIFPHKGLPCHWFHSHFPRSAALEVPAEDRERLTADLVARGVDPDRWFAVMHYRQGSTFRRSIRDTRRDVDPANYHALAHYVCATLGGQMVRIGHPGMDLPPPAPGYIDLSTAPLELQFFAVSKARFMVCGETGLGALGSAFKVPLAKTNAFMEDFASYPHDLLLPKNIVNWKGEVLSFCHPLKRQALTFNRLVGDGNFRFVDNNFEQLRYCADHLFRSTGPCEGWRGGPAGEDPPPPNALVWPGYGKRGAEALDLSEMLGLPVRLFP